MPQHSPEFNLFQGLIPEHEPPQTVIIIKRNYFVGFNQYGRPESVTETIQSASSPEEAIQYIYRGQEKHNHEVVLKLTDIDLSAKLVIDINGKQFLWVKSGDREGISPRNVKGHHAVSTDYETSQVICLCIQNDSGNTIFDRGIAWLDLSDEDNLEFKFNIMQGTHTIEELREGFLEIAQKGEEIIKDLLKGMDLELPKEK